MGRSSKRDLIAEYCRNHGGEFTYQTVAEATNVSDSCASTHLNALVASGELLYRKESWTKLYCHTGTLDTEAPPVVAPVVAPIVNQPVKVKKVKKVKKVIEPVVETRLISVTKQFEMISHIAGMVMDGVAPSFLLTGMAGVGKTYAVREELEARGLQKGVDYQWVSGKASPLGLFETLHNNREGIVIFDDCDDVLKIPGAIGILKSALDLYKTRVISWPSKCVSDRGLDEHFEFSGQVIFISNIDFSKLADALTSRAFKVDVYLTPDQVIEKLHMIIGDITPNGINMRMDYKQDALDAIVDLKDEILKLGKRLDIRAFEKACLLRQSAGDTGEWDHIKTMIQDQI